MVEREFISNIIKKLSPEILNENENLIEFVGNDLSILSIHFNDKGEIIKIESQGW